MMLVIRARLSAHRSQLHEERACDAAVTASRPVKPWAVWGAKNQKYPQKRAARAAGGTRMAMAFAEKLFRQEGHS